MTNKNSSQTIETKPFEPKRRKLLNLLWVTLGLAFLGQLSWVFNNLLQGRKRLTADATEKMVIRTGAVSSMEPGSVKAIPEAMLYLCRLDDGSFLALSKTCTHMGCALVWKRDQQRFVCPCHGSTFSRQGLVQTAPATRPMDYYPVSIDKNEIFIDVSKPLKRQAFDSSQTTGG